MAIVPITLLYTAVRLTFFPDAHVVLAGVIGNVVSVALLTWLAMPIADLVVAGLAATLTRRHSRVRCVHNGRP